MHNTAEHGVTRGLLHCKAPTSTHSKLGPSCLPALVSTRCGADVMVQMLWCKEVKRLALDLCVYALAAVIAIRLASVPELVNLSSSMLGKRLLSSCTCHNGYHMHIPVNTVYLP